MYKETHMFTCDVCQKQERGHRDSIPSNWRAIQLCFEDSGRMKYFGDDYHVCWDCMTGTPGSTRLQARLGLFRWAMRKLNGEPAPSVPGEGNKG